MSKQNVIIGLMILVGILIVGIAVYVFSHISSGLNMTQGIVLVAVAIVGLLVIMGVIFVLMKSLMSKK